MDNLFFAGIKASFPYIFVRAPLTENGEEILVGRLNEALKDGKDD